MFKSLPHLPASRRWHQQANPRPAVVALIRRTAHAGSAEAATQHLLIQRQKEPYVGKWALVGGGWDFGEELGLAITREVKEETGLDSTFVGLRSVVNERIAPLATTDDGAHFLLFVCEVSAIEGEAREQSEGPVAWFNSEELRTMNAQGEIVPTDYAMIQRFGQASATIPYVEAEVIAGNDAQTLDDLVRFEAAAPEGARP